MTNAFYNRVYDFVPFTSARGETVRDEFEAVELGFDRVNESLSQTLAEAGSTVRFTAGDLGTGVIADNAASRAGKLQGFDNAGLPAVHAASELDGFNGVHTLDFATHGFTLPTHGFIAVNRAPGGVAAAVADAHEHAATAFIVGVPDENSMRVTQRGFLTVLNHGLAVGAVYFLDQTAPGITATQPSAGVIQPLAEVWSATQILLLGALPTVKA